MKCLCGCGADTKEGNKYINGHNNNRKGCKLSDQQKKNVSEGVKKGQNNPVSKQKMIDAKLGKCWTELQRKNIIKAWDDENLRKKQSELIKLGMNKNEVKNKISIISKNNWKKEEYRNKVSASKKIAMNKPDVIEKIKKARMFQSIPLKDTSIEIKIQNILIENKVIFEKHKSIFGQPDIFIEPNICIFADGDYWHNLDYKKERDIKVNEFLKNNGYVVLRFWEHEINEDVEKCFQQINLEIIKCLLKIA
jgi:DNA mismatch endonuclease (patch repair protein)